MNTKFLLLFVTAFFPLCRADSNLSQVLSELPPCGLNCIIATVPASGCIPIANTTCPCGDKSLHNKILSCVLSNCTVEQAIGVAKAQAEICNLPKRSKVKDIYATLSVELLAGICVLLRLFSRWYTVSSFEKDDYVMIIVTIFYIPFLAIGEIAGFTGFGRDIWDVSPSNLTEALKLFYIDEAFYLTILALTKISILCFYLRIFPQRGFRLAAFAIMVWIGVCAAIFVPLQVFQCVPVSWAWDGWSKPAAARRQHCADANALAYAAAGLSVAQDLAVLALPVPPLLRLNASCRRRAAILLMFSLGIFVVITSCVRLRYIVLFARSTDPTWDYTGALIWSGIEVAVSIIVTSLPAIRVLLKQAVPVIFSTFAGSRDRSQDARLVPSAEESHKAAAVGSFRSKISTRLHGDSRSAQSRLFSMMARSRAGDGQLSGSELELGDKTNGDVRTEVVSGVDEDVTVNGSGNPFATVGSNSGSLESSDRAIGNMDGHGQRHGQLSRHGSDTSRTSSGNGILVSQITTTNTFEGNARK